MSDDTDITLHGGNMTPVVRRGSTVRREAGPWTPTIHRLLDHLRERGITWAPHPVGIEGDREVLTFVEGTVHQYPMPAEVWSESTLIDSARRLRAMHDASLDFVARDAVWRQPSHEPAEVICHNDFAPYNFVFNGGHIVGVIDWDMASPGTRSWDLAYLAYRIVPLTMEATGAPDHDRAARLELLLESYGGVSEHALMAVLGERLERLAKFTEDQAALQLRDDLLEHARLYRADAARLRDGR